jgi:hypothetical protein
MRRVFSEEKADGDQAASESQSGSPRRWRITRKQHEAFLGELKTLLADLGADVPLQAMIDLRVDVQPGRCRLQGDADPRLSAPIARLQ